MEMSGQSPLYLRVKIPGTHWIGIWVDPRAGLDAVAKIKKSLSLPGIEPRLSSP